jgi:hypothetical protein
MWRELAVRQATTDVAVRTRNPPSRPSWSKARWDAGGGKSYQYKTKGHRVIAMPLCLTGLAPPAFTAPCRNQTSDLPLLRARGVPTCFLRKEAGSFAERTPGPHRFVVRTYTFVRSQPDFGRGGVGVRSNRSRRSVGLRSEFSRTSIRLQSDLGRRSGGRQ